MTTVRSSYQSPDHSGGGGDGGGGRRGPTTPDLAPFDPSAVTSLKTDGLPFAPSDHG